MHISVSVCSASVCVSDYVQVSVCAHVSVYVCSIRTFCVGGLQI